MSSATIILAPDGLNDDYSFHYVLSQDLGNCPEPYLKSACESYPYLSHVVSKPFAYTPTIFKVYHIFLLTLIIPLLLFYLTKNWLSILFYFGTVSWFAVVDGTIAQTFGIIIFLLFLLYKHPAQRVILFLLGLMAHSTLMVLLLATWILETFFSKENTWLIGIPSFPHYNNNLFNLVQNFFLGGNTFVIIEAFKSFVFGRNLQYFGLFALSFIASLGVERAISIGYIVLILSVPNAKPTQQLVLFSLAWVFFVFVTFFLSGTIWYLFGFFVVYFVIVSWCVLFIWENTRQNS
jgi:hypothetical protein